MKETAITYYLAGLSVIPIDEKKVPIGKWKHKQSELIKPNGEFTGVDRIGVVTGAVSGYLQCIDIDTKYDITGTLFEDYKRLINSVDKSLLKLLTVQKTQSGGYHFIFKCKEIEGNQKLAKRQPTPDELIANPKEKSKALIETRGEGGYIAVYPTPKYQFIYGNITDVKEITIEQRQTLLDCARTFNEYIEPVYEKKEQKKVYENNLSPFEDWNNRGDVLELLEQEGWKVTLQRGSKNLLLRPNGEGKWSADWDDEKRLFYVWTSSSDFENEKAYNPTQVLNTLRFKDYLKCAHWLLDNGYGERQKSEKPKEVKSAINLDDDNYDFIVTKEETDEYLKSLRNGTFKMGLSTGIKTLDKHFVFKRGNLVIVNGADNVGKSTVIWYLMLCCSQVNGWKWIVLANENSAGYVKRKLIEFYTSTVVTELPDTVFKKADDFITEHFTFVKSEELYTYRDVLNMATKIQKRKKHDGILIDPYNSLKIELNDSSKLSTHEYHYEAASELRSYGKKNDLLVFLNCHVITNALRNKDSQGYMLPPQKADTEGGGKFANKADEFITIHRLTQHPTDWMRSQLHIRKVKEYETGGSQTLQDQPFILRMTRGSCGFEDETGFNLFAQKTETKAFNEYVESIKSIPDYSTQIQSKGKEEDFLDEF